MRECMLRSAPAPLLRRADAHANSLCRTITQYPFFDIDHSMQLKVALDNAFQTLALKEAGLGNASASSTIQWRKFPTPHPRIAGFDAVAQQGGNWFYVVPMITFYLLLVELVEEKEARLRLGMRMMGLRTSAYWAAWGTYAGAANLFTAAILTAAGNVAGFKVFTNTSWAIPILLYWSFGAAMSCMAGCMSTLVKRTKTAQTVAFTFVLIGFVFQVIIDTGYAALINILFASYVSWGVKAFRWILSLYPAFNQSVIFYGIAAKASSEFHRYTGTVVQGPGFFWADLARTRQVWFFGKQITVPAPYQALLLIFANGIAYALLTLYLDAVLEGDQGTAAHPCFCCGPLRRLCNRVQGKAADDGGAFSLLPPSPMPSPTATHSACAGTGVAEEELVAAQVDWRGSGQLGSAGALDGVSARVLGLRKTYRADACCGAVRAGRYLCSSVCPGMFPKTSQAAGAGGSGAVHAVQGTSFTLRQDEILGLCGHNGAGKTTTIHILTGLFAATAGTAEILGHDVGSGAEVEQVQRLLGVCPQHDVLWPHLTAREHLLLFARIKGLKGGVPAAEAEADRLLAMVDLTAAANRGAGGFSGGMRRRLSTAIAVIGDPAVVFLDEPAAGLDPVNQRSLWSLIQKLKVGRSILLTSHSMLEVDTLADRVAIMAHGRMHAMGTPLRLKREHGGGYRISLTLAPVPQYMRLGKVKGGSSHSNGGGIDLQLASLHGVLQAAEACLGGIKVTAEHYDAGAVSLAIPDAAPGDVFRLPYLLEWLTRDALAHKAAAEGLSREEKDSLPRLGTKWRSSDGCELLPPVQGFVSEWAVSRATLQEVFLAVNEAADGLQSAQANGGEGGSALPLGGASSPGACSQLAADASAAFAAATGRSTTGGSFTLRDSGDTGLSPSQAPSAGVQGRTAGRGRLRTASDGPAVLARQPTGCTQSPKFAPFRGLCLKNWTLLVRQRGQCACQVLSPLLVMALLLIVQEIIKYQFGTDTTATAPSLVIPLNINQNPLLGGKPWPKHLNVHAAQEDSWLHSRVQSLLRENDGPAGDVAADVWQHSADAMVNALWGRTLDAFHEHPEGAAPPVRSSTGGGATAAVQSHGEALGGGGVDVQWHAHGGAFLPQVALPQESKPILPINGSDCMEYFYVSASPQSLWPLVGALNSSGSATGLLGRIPQSSCLLRNGSTVATPFFEPRASVRAAQRDLYSTMEMFNSIDVRQLGYMPPCDDPPKGCPAYLLPDGEVAFNEIRVQPPSDLQPQAQQTVLRAYARDTMHLINGLCNAVPADSGVT